MLRQYSLKYFLLFSDWFDNLGASEKPKLRDKVGGKHVDTSDEIRYAMQRMFYLIEHEPVKVFARLDFV